MIPETGNLALILALLLATVQGILPLTGALRGDRRKMALAVPAAIGQFAFVTLAFGCLVASFVANDFSVQYVASNSNSQLPWYYRVSATWGGHEGSLLLWTWMLAAWTMAVALLSGQLPEDMLARILAVLGLVAVGFLLFMLFTSNPFERLLPGAIEGRDLNPLLQDFGMIIHPPLLYMGYVGFSVAFAFAIAALIGGRLDASWARWSRPWTLVAWCFLTLGIAMGSFWAYYELGWGGWWFWDAVENASFMPWLVGTALIHSLAVTEKRGSFKNWTVLLAILAFSLSLLGTFLVRSGVLTSVHAFATDPRRGAFILVFLALVIGVSLLLYAWRAPHVGRGGAFAAVSRESMLLLNNVFLLAATGTVLLGTLYPLFLDALGMGKISVGPPYFEAVFAPLMAPVLLLMGAAPFFHWKQASLQALWRKLRWLALAALGVAGGLGLLLAAWILLASAAHLAGRGRPGTAPLSYYGMLAAHAGIGVFVIGVTLVKGYEDGADASLAAGQTAALGNYSFTLERLEDIRGPNYDAVRATFAVRESGVRLATLYPEKRLYRAQQSVMTEAAIERGFTRDLYVALGEQTGSGRWVVRLQHKPFVGWIWSGCLIIALGGALAAGDRRYRMARQRAAATASVPAAA